MKTNRSVVSNTANYVSYQGGSIHVYKPFQLTG